jgi:hypothetical protein
MVSLAQAYTVSPISVKDEWFFKRTVTYKVDPFPVVVPIIPAPTVYYYGFSYVYPYYYPFSPIIGMVPFVY